MLGTLAPSALHLVFDLIRRGQAVANSLEAVQNVSRSIAENTTGLINRNHEPGCTGGCVTWENNSLKLTKHIHAPSCIDFISLAIRNQNLMGLGYTDLHLHDRIVFRHLNTECHHLVSQGVQILNKLYPFPKIR